MPPTNEEVEAISEQEEALARNPMKLSRNFNTVKLRRPSDLPYSMPIVKKKFTLNSEDAKSLLKHYEFTSTAMFKMGITLRRYESEENVDELRRVVFSQMVDPLKKYIEDITAKYQEMAVPEEYRKNNKVEYTQPVILEVELSYPGALHLIDLLVTLDNLLFHLSELWYALVIEDGEYYRVKTEARTRLKNDEIQIEQLVRKAVQKAEKEARNREKSATEDAAVEAGAASLQAAASKKAPGNGRGRKTLKTTSADGSEPGKEGADPGPGTVATGPGEEAFSPFREDPEAAAATT